jgi:hypothetical protein
MNFPIHISDLDALVADLRKEGFDARSDIFNGQVGLIVGPVGLDPRRLPPDTAALFFPLWEINFMPNRELIERRRFHEVFENRPADWQLSQPTPGRINLRHWNRSASQLGSGKVEEAVQQELIRRYPPNLVPVNIDVLGGQAQAHATVFVTNPELGINEQRRAMPEVQGGKAAAILDAVADIISELRTSSQIPMATGPDTYTGLNLSLRAIGRVGQGPDMTKWTEVYQYMVENLPPGEQAWIANFGAPYRQNWKILRATGDFQSDWRGDHESPEAALAVIEEELNGGSPIPSS